MGAFGDLDIKTSQRSKLGKKWKIGHFNKILKNGHYSFLYGMSYQWFRNALKPTRIYEWKQGTCKGHQYEITCITIQLLMSAITPLNHMQKD